MASAKQRKVAKRNIRKALKRWMGMSSRSRARAQPQGRARKKPGTTGKGKYYRVVVRSKSEFSSFRNQDVGKKGHLQRLAGKRKSGSWATQAWLIAKSDAFVKGNALVGKTKAAKEVLSKLKRKPKRVKGDVFEAGPRRNVPEKSKPTLKMRKAQKRNIKKAQAVRKKKR